MTAIVTGSDSGIGRATAVALARGGHDVAVTWHTDAAGARDTAREVEREGRRAVIGRLDTAEATSARDTVGALISDLGGVEVLVNASGTGDSTPFLEHSVEEFEHIVSVDLVGAFVVALQCARAMVAAGRGGRIVNVTSVHEHVPLRGSSAYTASKHALGGLTKVMALELAEHAITVNAVAPGEIATPMTGQEDEDPHGTPRPGIPAGRPGDAREVAALITWLCSDAASYVTGASYSVDGGMLLMAAMANQLAGD